MIVWGKFTPVQQLIIRLVVKGMKNRDIAAICGLTENAIKRRVVDIFDLVGCESRLQLAVLMVDIVNLTESS